MRRLARRAPFVVFLPLTAACVTVIQLGDGTRHELDAGADATPPQDAAVEVAAPPDAAPPCTTITVGTTTHTALHAGLQRSYDVIRPASVVDPCKKPRALFGFHPYASTRTAQGFRRDILLARAEIAGVLAIFPEGSVAGGKTGWSCSGCTAYQAADDVGFVRQIAAELEIDLGRSSALGADLGGSFVHRLVAELPLPIGAVFAGALVTTPSEAAAVDRPIPRAPATMILEHGALDTIYPYNGGRGGNGDAVSSFLEAAMLWRAADDCPAAPTTVTTKTSSTQRSECKNSTIIAVKWLDSRHITPDDDPENPDVGVRAVVDRLLAP